MTKYYGYWSNGNSWNREPYEDTNLRRLKKTMRGIARGNNTGTGCRWLILDSLDDETYQNEHTVARGRD